VTIALQLVWPRKGDIPPKEERKEARWNNDGLEGEEVSQSVHGKKRNSGLDEPVEENHEELTARDNGAVRKCVGEVRIRWPDGGDHVFEVSSSLNRCNGSPHQSDESSNQNCGNTTPHTERDTRDDREGNMVQGANSTFN
jgi:hypothetical protein